MCFDARASSLVVVSAASGGLDGGDGNPELTSGKPLYPASAGSGVMKAFQEGSLGIDDIATGEDICTTCKSLAITITTTITTGMLGCHFVIMPRLLLEKTCGRRYLCLLDACSETVTVDRVW